MNRYLYVLDICIHLIYKCSIMCNVDENARNWSNTICKYTGLFQAGSVKRGGRGILCRTCTTSGTCGARTRHHFYEF